MFAEINQKTSFKLGRMVDNNNNNNNNNEL